MDHELYEKLEEMQESLDRIEDLIAPEEKEEDTEEQQSEEEDVTGQEE